jgi:hypothetical protein
VTKGTVRIGISSRADRREIGRHFALFHLVRINNKGGRLISIGYQRLDRRDLARLREEGIRLRVTVIGILRLGADVSPALVEATIDAKVRGMVLAASATRAAVRDH